MAADGSCFILSRGDLFKSLLHKISCAVAAAAAAAAVLRVEEPVWKRRQASALTRSQMNGGDKQEMAASWRGSVLA